MAVVVSSTVAPAKDPKIHRWNLNFDGKGDPAALLKRLAELLDAENIATEKILSLQQLIFREKALWYQHNLSNITT